MKKILLLLVPCFSLLSSYCFSQNVGIGTTTPTRAKLEVHGAVGSTSAIFGGESTGISLQRNWPGIGFNHYYNFDNGGHKYIANGFAAMQFFDPSSGYMALDMFGNGVANGNTTAPRRVFTIANNGNMGINTGPANASLYVRKGINFDGSAVFGGSTHNSHFNYSSVEDTYIRGGINGSNVYINDIPGGIVSIGGGTTKVGINTYGYPPSYTLEVHQVKEPSGAETGILLVNSLFNHWEIFHNLPLSFKYNGNIVASIHWEDGHYGQISDGRLKTNVQPLPGILDKLMKLRPVEYEMKTNSKEHERRIGFIAQEIKLEFPGLVTVSKDTGNGYKAITDLHMMDYSGFGVLAIKAIQEQQQMINDLQKRTQLLEEQNKMLMQLLKQKN